MVKFSWNDRILLAAGGLLVAFGLSGTVLAQAATSPSYRIDESTLGPGGSIQSNSANYQEAGSVGDLGVNSSASANYTAVAGYNTTNEPRLAVIVNNSSVSFGQLSSATTTTASATFSVLNYTAHGYSVYTGGASPGTGSHNLTGLSAGGTSTVGTEQYGINLKLNTSPAIGAEAVQVPGGTFSYGKASTGYDTVNTFRYNNGERIAQSDKSSGETDYTISYMVNISTFTPAGTYTGKQNLVVVGAY